MSKRLRSWFWLLALIIVGAVGAVLATGGQPDPIGPAIALDGTWRFHPGDDPKWADPQTDDRKWDRLVLKSLPSSRDNDVGLPGWIAGWRAHGYPDLAGYGWYRRRVTLPTEEDVVLLGPTMVNDSYEMFWNGQLIGGIGKLGPNPKMVGARPLLVELPRAANQHLGVLAIRAFMQPAPGRDKVSGGLRSVPTLATVTFGHKLHQAQWMRTIAGYIVEAAIPFMMVLLAGIALAVASSTARPSFARWLSIALITTAWLRLGHAIYAWTDLIGASTLDGPNSIIVSPLTMLAWTAAWNEWVEDRARRVVLACALAACAARIAGVIVPMPVLIADARLAFIMLFAVIAVRVALRGEDKMLVLATMTVIAVGLFSSELSKLGVPTIWFPFNIGVTLTQYAYGLSLFLLPLALPRAAVAAGAQRLQARSLMDRGFAEST